MSVEPEALASNHDVVLHLAQQGEQQQQGEHAAHDTSNHLWTPEHAAALAHAAHLAQAAHLAEAARLGAEGDHSEAGGYTDDPNDASEADALKRTTKKKSKGGRIASEITREELSECFNMPSEDAANRLGIGLTVLKRICRKFGVPRWPYRKIKSLDRLITNVESGTPPGETYKHLMKSAEEIRESKKTLCSGQAVELDDKTKKLQQAYSKFNHKQRKAQKDDDPCNRETGWSPTWFRSRPPLHIWASQP